MEICNASWELREVTPKTIAKKADGECLGYADLEHQIIYIDSTLHPHRKQLTIVHEWLHVIIDRSGYQKDDEAVISALEHGVYEMIQKFHGYFGEIEEDGHN